jgi:ribonuclease P protein component
LKQFGLSKRERIKKKKEFSIVYSSGITLYSESKKFKVVFLIREIEPTEVKAAFGVYKKAGSAVWRNRVKRLMRESYRLNKLFLFDKCKNSSRSLLMVFSPNSVNQKNYKRINLSDVEPEILNLLKKLEKRI